MCGGVTAAIHRPEAGTALSLKGSGGGVWVHVRDLAGIWIMWVKRGKMITNLRHVYAWIQPQPLTSVKLPLYNILAKLLFHTLTHTHTHFKWKKCIQDVEKYWTFNSDSIKEQLCHSFIIFLKCSCLLPFNTHATQTTGYEETALEVNVWERVSETGSCVISRTVARPFTSCETMNQSME